MPSTTLTDDDFADGVVSVLDMMIKVGIAKSKGEGRRLIQQGGVAVNDEKVTDVNMTLSASDFDSDVILRKGKKVFHKFTK